MTRLLPRGFTHKLITLERPVKQLLMMLTDIIALVFAGWLAYSLRLGNPFVPNQAQALLLLAAPLLAIPVFIRVGLYRAVIRFLGEQALWSVIKGMVMASLLWAALAFLSPVGATIQGMPRSIPILYCLIGTGLVGGVRFAARWLLWTPLRKRFSGRQVLIYGAGVAGQQLAASLRRGRHFFPSGFLDDDKGLHGKDIDGLRVYNPGDLPTIINQFDIHEVIVTLPSVSSAKRKEVVSYLEQFPVRVRILPAMADITSGRHLANLVREVDVGDLLGRDPVSADPSLLGHCITDKIVMVTGAGGSIGSELCRQIIANRPKKLILLENSELALYQIDRLMQAIAECPVISVMGSVTNEQLIKQVITEQNVQTLYHAAAHKHVPLVESNALEGIYNNVIGTWTVAHVALDSGVENFVLISTDKAVRPTNVMGATKRWAELIIQNIARKARASGTKQSFCAVRFGNVLGSSGSVIPLFKEQISNGGPVTVTHAEVTRYFMSIHEAVELVIQAGSMSEGGEIFLLDMGEPVKIIQLARNMIRLAGHLVRDDENPDGDIDISITGLRPGEKLHEELLIDSNNVEGTHHPRITKAAESNSDKEDIFLWLHRLQDAMKIRDEAEVKKVLMAALDADNWILEEAPPLKLVSDQ